MDLSNHEALASAFKQSQVSLDKIEDMGITPDWTEDQIDAKVKTLSEEKALVEGTSDWKKYSKGQQFYVEQLVKMSGMTNKELIEYNYKRAFADVATLDEMMEVMDARRPDKVAA